MSAPATTTTATSAPAAKRAASPRRTRSMSKRTAAAASAPDNARSVVRGEQLFAKAKALQAKLAEKATKMPAECTFAPKTNPAGSGAAHTPAKPAAAAPASPAKAAPSPAAVASPQAFPASAAVAPASTGKRQKRFERLYTQGMESRKKLAADAAKAQADATPTFKPQRVSKSTEPKVTVEGDLYSRGLAMREHAIEKATAAANVDAECSFMPVVTKKAAKVKGSARRRLYAQSSAEAQRSQQAKREALRARRELENCTFKPTIQSSATHKEAAATSPATSPTGPASSDAENDGAAKRRAVYDKLFADAKTHQAKLADAQLQALAHEKAECTFVPTISHKGKAKGKGAAEPTSPVHARLYKNGVETRARMAATAQAATDAECTFKPTISKASRVKAQKAIAKAGAGANADAAAAGAPAPAPRPAFERLYAMGTEAKAAKAAKAAPSTPKMAWQDMLRPEGGADAVTPSGRAPAPATLSPEQSAVFDRLYKESLERAARKRVPVASGASYEGPVDWELMLRDAAKEVEAVAKEAGMSPSTRVDADTVARQAAFFDKLFSDAKKSQAAKAASPDDAGAVDFARMLRGATATKTVSASPAAFAERLFKADLAGHKSADMDLAAADAQATLLRTCWQATLRTERPVALAPVALEATTV